MKDGGTANITWSDKGAFTKNSFVLPNGSHNWFKFYKQDEDIVEGPQIHAIWCDEMLYEIGLLKTLRYRLMKHQGILIITFTPKSGWTPTVAEYNQGRKVVVSLTAKRLPIRDDSGKVTGRYKQMPRVAIAGPGTEGGLKANIVWFNITDNPFVPETEIDRNLKGATEKVIMERGYGEATKAFGSKFPKFTEAVHCFDPKCLPRQGTRYQIVDPVDGRNWFVLWMLVDPLPITLRDGSTMHRRWIYREFPSTNGTHPSAYVTGVGDPGAWALPGDAADGQRGPAQESWGWGWERYKFEFERLEGKKGENVQRSTSNVQRPTEEMIPAVWRNRVRNPLKGSSRAFDAATVVSDDGREEIFERRMDSRYGNTPRGDKARTTTLIEQMAEIGLWYEPASGKDIGEGVQLINNLLDYDEEVEIGRYSPALRRINQPLLYVSTECPNLIYSLREWTGKDGAHGACKDPIDVLRYAVEDDLDFVGAETYAWAGGGTY
jgi:hypothetical protein